MLCPETPSYAVIKRCNSKELRANSMPMLCNTFQLISWAVKGYCCARHVTSQANQEYMQNETTKEPTLFLWIQKCAKRFGLQWSKWPTLRDHPPHRLWTSIKKPNDRSARPGGLRFGGPPPQKKRDGLSVASCVPSDAARSLKKPVSGSAHASTLTRAPTTCATQSRSLW